MKKFYILFSISLVGFIMTFVGVYFNDISDYISTKPIPKIKLPFNTFISATGIVEPRSKSIVVGSMVSGVVKNIFVTNSQHIKKGDLLFSIDNTELKNKIDLLKTKRTILVAKKQKAKHQFKLIEEFKSLSSDMVTSEKFKIKQDDYNIAKVSLDALDKQLKILTKKQELYKIYAPINGIILKSNLNIGEYFEKNNPKNMLIIGSDKLNLNVSINEYDIWKFKKQNPAIAFVRGHHKLKTNLKYLYTIPFVSPKISLSGKSTEKTDTRVLHIIYTLEDNLSFNLFTGQQLDLFIKTDK